MSQKMFRSNGKNKVDWKMVKIQGPQLLRSAWLIIAKAFAQFIALAKI